MGEAKDKEAKCVFAVSYEGQRGDPDRTPVMVVGIPTAAWLYMADGKTHTFDLASTLGIPVKLILFGGTTRAAVLDLLTEANAINGKPTIDATDHDFAMKPIENPDDAADPQGS